MKKIVELGSIISGTMRPEDLIPEFIDELKYLGQDCTDTSNKYDSMIGEDGYIIDDCIEEATWMLDELFNRLDEHAPDGCYFGAHPGDGADFGFWASEID